MSAFTSLRFATTIPRQHGAWSVLFLAYALGLAVGGVTPAGLLLLPAVLAALPLRHTALLWTSSTAPERRQALTPWLLAYGLLVAVSGVLLLGLYGRWLLLPLGAITGGLGLLTTVLEHRRLDRTLGAELLGMLGLSLVVPATAYTASGDLAATTLGLWLLAALVFGGSVFHVRFVVRGGQDAGLVSVVFHLVALSGAWALAPLIHLPTLAFLSLVPAALRAVWAAVVPGGRRPTIRRLGFEELGYSAAFVLLVALAYRL